MIDLGDGIWATAEAIETAKSLDTIIFDVDGVLLDVSQSFRKVSSITCQYYLTRTLGWPDDGLFFAPSETELFKRVGGFNSDWSLTNTATLLFLAKGIDAQDRSAATLRALSPTLEEYTAVIGERGGGEDAAIAYLREVIPPDAMQRGLDAWDTALLERIFCEYYAGRSHCKRIYGFEPGIVDQEIGELTKENVIIRANDLPSAFQYGIVTGRVRGELDVAMEMTNLDGHVAPGATMTADDGMHKPDPNGLIALADFMHPSTAAFVGDTLDDMRTVHNYRKVRETPAFLACQVLTGPAGERNRQFFADRGADVIAPNVNALVGWLAKQRNGKP
ncbi:MAG TPA: HAD family hydrolase [Armatimonadota bacterium]|jgi:HAD superfamily hydrolase (TIGR01548 family)